MTNKVTIKLWLGPVSENFWPARLTRERWYPILLVTHSPRLSPARAMRIKGEFFYAPVYRRTGSKF